MKLLGSRQFGIGVAMLLAAGLAVALTPRIKMSEQGRRLDVAKAIPLQFGDWKADQNQVAVVVSPDVEEKLYGIYDQTLARTYVDSKGETVMLSIAYGGDQVNEKMQVHRPDFCYRNQGYEVRFDKDDLLPIEGAMVPVRRLKARLGARYEPISYWVTVGGKATLPGMGRKFAQIVYGLTGKVADGMLVRVSSLQRDVPAAYALQDRFLVDMVKAIDPADRARFIGAI